MGTVADKLNAVLASKNAIKAKFGLSDTLPFSRYADSIEGGTDVSDTTATAPDVLEGKKFYDAAGQPTIGTLVQGGGEPADTDFYLCNAMTFVPAHEATFSFKLSLTAGWAKYAINEDGTRGELIDDDAIAYHLNFTPVYGIIDPRVGLWSTNDYIIEGRTLWCRRTVDGLKIIDYEAQGGRGNIVAYLSLPSDANIDSSVVASDEWQNDVDSYIASEPGGTSFFPGDTSGTWYESYEEGHASVTDIEEAPDSGTWTRQKIVFVDGKYQLSDEVETVSYDPSIAMPEVGSIYSGDLKCKIANLYPAVDLNAQYLCSYVNRNYFSYNTIVVSGMPTDAFVGATYTDQETWESADVPADIAARDPNGTYTLTNPDETSASIYIWQSENGCVIKASPWGMGYVIYPADYYDCSKYLECSSGEGSYPVPDDYTSFTWSYYNAGSTTTVEGGSVVVPEPEAVEQYWEGYKLIQNEDGKYDYAVEVTRLTYADYMPVAGRIYDGACTMEITNANLSDDALWSCPHGMTANENEEWVITSTAVYGENYAWKAFDSDDSTSVWCYNDSGTNTVPWYIQWENKSRKTSIQRLVIYCYDSYFGDNSFFKGSNDGVNWTDIFAGNMWNNNGSHEEDKCKITLDLSHGTPYKYHRLGWNHNTGSYIIIYKIEAYSQLPREVPK